MDFNFISDEQFRSSLLSDYSEMRACAQSESWKSVHVLAGSIVEALLTEYLVVSGMKPGGKDPLKLTLDEAIQACLSAGVLKKGTAALCDVVREYRNLIHPGRAIRTSQDVTPEGGSIAINLVSLIVKEVAEKRKAIYGPTAEQILRKIRTDQHALAVLPQLLLETNEHERRKLVRKLIPEAYTSNSSDADAYDEQIAARLRMGFRTTFEQLDPSVQSEVASIFAEKVRTGSTEQIEEYGEAFFASSDIAQLSPQDATIVVEHLKGRLEGSQGQLSDGLMRQTSSLGSHLPKKSISKFADLMIRIVLRQPTASRERVIEWAEANFDVLEDEVKAILEKRIETWVKFGQEKNYAQESQSRLIKLQAKWIYIPF